VQEKAKKAAEVQRQRDARNTANAIKLSQKGKHKASKAILGSNKHRKRVNNAGDAKEIPEAPSAAPPITTRRGRNIKLPSKY
jgi:hypothetical protein